MPFTFAHPAAVLPLKKMMPRFLILEALIIGSLTPDLAYYFFQFRISSIAHTFLGSLYLDLPAGLALWAAYRYCLPILMPLFPASLAALMPAKVQWRWNSAIFAALCISILLGAWSHIVWDAFTHQRGAFGEIPLLNQLVFKFRGEDFQVYKILQHVSSVLGLLILYVFFWRNRKKTGEKILHKRGKIVFWFLLCLFSILVAYFITDPKTSREAWVYYFTLICVDVFILGLLASALAYGFMRKQGVN